MRVNKFYCNIPCAYDSHDKTRGNFTFIFGILVYILGYTWDSCLHNFCRGSHIQFVDFVFYRFLLIEKMLLLFTYIFASKNHKLRPFVEKLARNS